VGDRDEYSEYDSPSSRQGGAGGGGLWDLGESVEGGGSRSGGEAEQRYAPAKYSLPSFEEPFSEEARGVLSMKKQLERTYSSYLGNGEQEAF
jgi:hypothetical protein